MKSLTMLVVLLALTALAGPMPAEARRLSVTANGSDVGDCGSKSAPCRSISRAIEIAAPRDTIIVGPGRYGDLNGNGTLGEAGEEFGLNDVAVEIDKPVRILSSSGAGATTIDGGQHVGYVVMFRPGSDGARFGGRRKGFTLVDSDGDGEGLGTYVDTNGIIIEGNRAVGHAGHGFEICGHGHRVAGNWAIENGEDGIELNEVGHLAIGNVAMRNAKAGIALWNDGHTAVGNQVVANDLGIDVHGDDEGMTIRGNVVSANRYGVWLDDGGGHAITGNAILGNKRSGIFIDPSAGVLTITKNSIYGNDAFFVGGSNCGIENQSTVLVDAPRNFWGAPSGPGPDPADDLCAGSAATDPPLTRDVRVRTKTPQ